MVEFSSPEAAAALPGLTAELSGDPALAARVRGILERARDRGEIRDDVDLTLVVDAFAGTALGRALVLDRPVDPSFGARLVDLVLDGLVPRT